MTSFTGIAHYAPSLVLLAGLAWLAGLWGLGRAAFAVSGFRLPSPWAGVAAVVLGIQMVSLAVQLLGMMELSSRPVLAVIWGLVSVCGIASLAWTARQTRWHLSLRSPLLLGLLAVVVIAVITNLLVAVAPSTKIDEIYYHMLVPSRIVTDGALHFYQAPWVAAIWPQMIYEISAAPLHAIGYPDAPNVTSWGLGVMLLGFAWQFMRSRETPPVLAAILLGALCVGLYPTVWYGNGGAHAMGDLAMVAAIAALADRERLVAGMGAVRLAALVSLFLVCAATSKVSLLPPCIVLLGFNAWLLIGVTPGRQLPRLLAAFALPWIIFYLPIMIWTWTQSGSPFGPMMAGAFGPSLYVPQEMQAALRYARDNFQPSLPSFLFATAINYSPLVWLGVLAAIVASTMDRASRAGLAGLLLLQCGLILFLLPYDMRFLGGIHFGLLVVAGAFADDSVKRSFESPRLALAASGLLLLPWLAAQIYYARTFVPVALGLEQATAFYQRTIAYFDDYMILDRTLRPEDVLLAAEGHTSAVYAPRPIFFHSRDVPTDRRAVLFYAGPDKRLSAVFAAPYRLGPFVYTNKNAKAVMYRSGREPTTASLEVRLLHK